jgi:U-box domain
MVVYITPSDLIHPTVTAIKMCVSLYQDFVSYKDECEAFRNSLCDVVAVLEGIQHDLDARGSGGGATSKYGATKLRLPMELLEGATREGSQVLKKCASTRTLVAIVFSRQLMGILSKAKADVERALVLLPIAGIRIQISTRRLMDQVSDQLRELQRSINAGQNVTHQHHQAVVELIRQGSSATQPNADDHGAGIGSQFASLPDALVEMGVVRSKQDGIDQLRDVQREAENLQREAKVVYDEEILNAVLAFTARDVEGGRPKPGAADMDMDSLLCPISGEPMQDPVTVAESGITYDRKSLCASLLRYPDLDPATGQRFDGPLHYAPSILARRMVTQQMGDAYYQKYDDTDFKKRYDQIWTTKFSPGVPHAASGESDNEAGTAPSSTASCGGGEQAGDALDSTPPYDLENPGPPEPPHSGEGAGCACLLYGRSIAPRWFRRQSRRRQALIVTVIVLLVVAAIAIGAGVGITRARRHQDAHDDYFAF